MVKKRKKGIRFVLIQMKFKFEKAVQVEKSIFRVIFKFMLTTFDSKAVIPRSFFIFCVKV